MKPSELLEDLLIAIRNCVYPNDGDSLDNSLAYLLENADQDLEHLDDIYDNLSEDNIKKEKRN